MLAEEAAKHSHVSRGPLRSHRQNILFAGKFFRVLISIAVLWMLGAGIIIFLKAFPYLTVTSVIAVVLLTLASIFTFYTLWWRSEFATKILIYISLLTLLASGSVFFSLISTDADFKQPDLFWSFFMLIPSSIIFLFLAIVGRRAIFLANHAYLFSDEIEDYQFQASKIQDEESAIETIELC